MKTVQQGTNGFTCMPDNPKSPGNDPMCLDESGMAWLHALKAKEEPPAGKPGFIYMLMGGSVASNIDPYATEPAAGGKWVEDPPHMMILNVKEMQSVYPQPGETPDTTQSYVMWADTPYEHLMMPVK
jgi:hypothetical protein